MSAPSVRLGDTTLEGRLGTKADARAFLAFLKTPPPRFGWRRGQTGAGTGRSEMKLPQYAHRPGYQQESPFVLRRHGELWGCGT